MGEISTFDDFLGHRHGNGGGGGKRFSSDWKKDTGFLTLWLHTKQLPFSIWTHPFPKRWAKEKDGNTTSGWLMADMPCWEDENTLKARYRRGEDGMREIPPVRCPHCLWQEDTYLAIEDGDIDPFETMFEFGGSSDPKNNRKILAGGYCGLFDKKELSDDFVNKMKDHKIYRNETFKHINTPKGKYIMTAVDALHPESGVQILDENSSVGEAMKAAMRDAIQFYGGDRDKGNPFKNPYAIKLSYNANAEPRCKYTACRVEYSDVGKPIVLTPQIEKLITGAPPSLDMFTKPVNSATLQTTMEKHLNPKLREVFEKGTQGGIRSFFAVTIDLQKHEPEKHDDVDHFMGNTVTPATPATDPRGSVSSAASPPASFASAPVAASEVSAPVEHRRKKVEAAPATPQLSTVKVEPCTECGTPFPVTETKCPKCGTEFDQIPF